MLTKRFEERDAREDSHPHPQEAGRNHGAPAAERLPFGQPHLRAADRRRQAGDDRLGQFAGAGQDDGKKHIAGGNIAAAKQVGKLIAERAKEKGIEAVVFDRGGYLYHGRIKAVADAAREGGLKF